MANFADVQGSLPKSYENIGPLQVKQPIFRKYAICSMKQSEL